jgi:hypothetical protein
MTPTRCYTDSMEKKRVESETEEEIYLAWSSPSRLFKKRDKEYFRNIAAIVFLLVVILIFAREFLLIAAVLSIVFLIYVLSTVAPEDVPHKLTNLGIESVGHFYRWEELNDFWFEEQWDQTMVVVRPILGTRLILLLGTHAPKDKVREILARHIPFRETPEKSWIDNAATWLSEKIPLEKQTS